MIGGLIGGAVIGVMLADLLAFYMLSSIFAYSYEMAWTVAYAAFAYVQVAWWVTQSKEHSANYRFVFLRRLHAWASKWLWYLLGAVLLLSMPIQLLAEAAATQRVHYVELAGTWAWQTLNVRQMGSDSTSTPTPRRSPLLRDIPGGEIMRAFDDTEKSEGYGLIWNRAIEIKPAYCKVYAKPYSVLQAKVHLETTVFGKNRIVRVEYVDFEALPPAVQQSVVRRMGGMRSAVLPLWHLGKAHPELAALIEQSLASASAIKDD